MRRRAAVRPLRHAAPDEPDPAIETDSMNAISSEVVAPASTELAMPANSTPNATTVIASAAAGVDCDASVPTHTSAAVASASVACAHRRSGIGPPNSTSRSIAKAPNAANVASVASPRTMSPNANSAGITIAVRAARGRAATARRRARRQSNTSARRRGAASHRVCTGRARGTSSGLHAGPRARGRDAQAGPAGGSGACTGSCSRPSISFMRRVRAWSSPK